MKLLEFLKKEFLLFKRNKKQIGIVIALPLVFALIYTLMFSSSVNISLVICNLDSGSYGQEFVNSISGTYNIKYFESNTTDSCFSIIKENILDGSILGLRIPESFTKDLDEFNTPTIDLYFDNSKPNLGFFAQSMLINSISSFNSEVISNAQNTIKQSTSSIQSDLSGTLNLLEILEPSIPSVSKNYFDTLYSNINNYYTSVSEINDFNLEFVVKPVNTILYGVFEGNNNKGFSFSVLYIVLNVLVLVLLSSISIVYDKRNNFIVRLRSTTNTLFYYILSKILFFSLIGFIIFIPSFLVFLFQNAFFSINYLSLIVSVFLISMTSTLIGLVIGFSSKDESSSIMISVFIGLIVMLLSGLFYPIEFLPSVVKSLLLLVPTALQANILNNALVFNSSLSILGDLIFSLLIYDVVFLIISVYFMVKNSQ